MPYGLQIALLLGALASGSVFGVGAPYKEIISFYVPAESSFVTVDADGSDLDRVEALDAPSLGIREQFIVEKLPGDRETVLLKTVQDGLFLKLVSGSDNRIYGNGTDQNDTLAHFRWEQVGDAGVRLSSRHNGQFIAIHGTQNVLRANQSDPADGVVFEYDVRGPWIADVQYSDGDTPLYTLDALDFGADPSGTGFSHAAIQRAIDVADSQGGGIVYLPAGRYRVGDTIDIRENVTLRGDWKRPTASDKSVAGTVILVEHGSGERGPVRFVDNQDGDRELDKNDVAFLIRNNGVLRDLSVFYPNQDVANPVPYPFTVDCLGTYSTALNLTLVNSFEGIYASGKHVAPEELESAFVDATFTCAINIFGSPLQTGINVFWSNTAPRFENIEFGPEFWAGSGLGDTVVTEAEVINAMRMRPENSAGFRCGPADGGNVYGGIDLRGYDVGFEVPEPQTPRLFDFRITDCRIGLDIQSTKVHGWVISHGRIEAEEVALRVGGQSSYVALNNVSLASDQELVRHGRGVLSLVNCRFERWGTGYAVESYRENPLANKDPNLAVIACEFLQEADHIQLGSDVYRAVVVGNLPQDDLRIRNLAGGEPSIVVDTETQWDFARSSPLEVTVREMVEKRLGVPTLPSQLPSVINVKAPPYNAHSVAHVSDPEEPAYDAGVAIQAALDEAGRIATPESGCVVYVPPGVYRVSGYLDVPSYVELRGVNERGVESGSPTVLCLFADKGSPDSRATIRLSADSGIRGLCLFRPEQKWDFKDSDIVNGDTSLLDPYVESNLFPYPFAVEGTNRNWAYDLQMPNLYNGIDFSAGGGHALDFLYGCTLNEWIRLGGDGERTTVLNLQAKNRGFRFISEDTRFPNSDLLKESGFASGIAANRDRDGGLEYLGTGLVFEGDGEFLSFGHFITHTGEKVYAVEGSPKVRSYASGGEGRGIGYHIVSENDSVALDFEAVCSTFHSYANTVSDSTTGPEDLIRIFNSKQYGDGLTVDHRMRGAGRMILQQEYRAHASFERSFELGDSATLIMEGLLLNDERNAELGTVSEGNQVAVFGLLSDRAIEWIFDEGDDSRIYAKALSPSIYTGFSGNGGAFAPPPAPETFWAFPGDSFVHLNWAPSAADDLAGYRVYRQNGQGDAPTLIGETLAPGLVDLEVANGSTYDYLLAAVDTLGVASAAVTVFGARPEPVARYESEGVVDVDGDAADPSYSTFGGSLLTEPDASNGYAVKLQRSTSIEWPVFSVKGGLARLGFLILSPQTNERQAEVFVNGTRVDTITQRSDTWIEQVLTDTPLRPGWNAIELRNPGSDAGVHVDYMTIAIPNPDTDGDRMEDGWEILMFGDTELSDGSGDLDGDGIPDFFEFLRRTDPLQHGDDSAAILRAVRGPSDEFVLEWDVPSDRVLGVDYKVEFSADLTRWWNPGPEEYELEATPGDSGSTVLRLRFSEGTTARFGRLTRP